MKLKVRDMHIETGGILIALINQHDARLLDLHAEDRVLIKNGNKKTVRKVLVNNKKGYKSISKFRNGKHVKTVKRPLKPKEIKCVKEKKFLPKLFDNCKCIV